MNLEGFDKKLKDLVMCDEGNFNKINYSNNTVSKINYQEMSDIHFTLEREYFKKYLDNNSLSSCLCGETITKIMFNNDALLFETTNKNIYIFSHVQDCCEDVFIKSIDGDLNSLIGEPLVMCECVTDKCDDDWEYGSDASVTYTFYKFATIKGYVTIAWEGASNGYYSEEVDIYKFIPKTLDQIKKEKIERDAGAFGIFINKNRLYKDSAAEKLFDEMIELTKEVLKQNNLNLEIVHNNQYAVSKNDEVINNREFYNDLFKELINLTKFEIDDIVRIHDCDAKIVNYEIGNNFDNFYIVEPLNGNVSLMKFTAYSANLYFKIVKKHYQNNNEVKLN